MVKWKNSCENDEFILDVIYLVSFPCVGYRNPFFRQHQGPGIALPEKSWVFRENPLVSASAWAGKSDGSVVPPNVATKAVHGITVRFILHCYHIATIRYFHVNYKWGPWPLKSTGRHGHFLQSWSLSTWEKILVTWHGPFLKFDRRHLS